ncbi:MAG: PAS domain S-box protein [Candidatus Hodarchaeales archaeon]
MFNEDIATKYFTSIDKFPSSSNKERKKAVNYFLMFLDKENLNFTDGLESKDLVNFVNFLSNEEYYEFGKKKKDKLSTSTVHQIIALLKSFFKFNFDTKLILTHPDLIFDENLKKNLPKLKSKPKKIISSEKDIQKSILETHKLLDEASDSKKAILWTLYNSMTSISIVLEALLADMDLEHRRLLLRDKKNSKVIEVILYDRSASVLEEYISKHRPLSDSEFLFLSKYKEKLTTRTIQRYLKDHSLKVLGKPVTPHALKQLGLLHVQETGANIDKIINQRIQAEKALKASEARFQTLVETMTDGLLVLGIDGTVTYCNPTFCEMQDQSSGELVGSHISTLFLGEPIENVLQQLEETPRENFTPYEQSLTTKDGKTIWTIISPSILYVESKEGKNEVAGAIAVITNITKQKETEEQLGERVKELNCLYEASKLLSDIDMPLDDVFDGISALIPPAWQYPEITCSRIINEGKEYTSEGFRESEWKQSADLVVNDKKHGTVEVYYLEERPEIDEGPFIKEERDLIDNLALNINKFVTSKQISEQLKQRTHDLGERIKEIRCLYGATQLLSDPEKAIEEVLNGINSLIPPAWQYPDITNSRIIFQGKEYMSRDFQESKWKQVADLIVDKKKIGVIEVHYLENRPFLKEERDLLNNLSLLISKNYDRIVT